MSVNQRYFEDVEIGDELPSLRKSCSPRQLVMFAAAARDFYEIHYDQDAARERKLDGLVIHGALKNAFLGQLLHDWVAPMGRVLRYRCSYRGLDYISEDLDCMGRVTGKRQERGENLVDLDVWIQKADGTVTTPGDGVVALPARTATRP